MQVLLVQERGLLAKQKICFDGKKNVTIEGNTTLTGLANGRHNLTVYVWDEAGNVGASETVNFTTDVPFPTTLVLIASVASLVLVGVVLLVYFKKRKPQKDICD